MRNVINWKDYIRNNCNDNTADKKDVEYIIRFVNHWNKIDNKGIIYELVWLIKIGHTTENNKDLLKKMLEEGEIEWEKIDVL